MKEKNTRDKENEPLDEVIETTSRIPVKLLYTPSDLSKLQYEKDLSYPGHYPFTRGVQPTMYRERLWTMRQYAGFGTAEESNIRYRYLLEQGQTGLSVAFDLPTQMGYDSDHPYATGEIGKVGVAIDSLEDMEILFNKIPLDRVSTSMTINSTAIILLTMYMAVAEKQKVEVKTISGTIQNDILKEYFARGTYIFPPKPSMRIITDIFAFCKDNLPRFNTISISGYHIREAGSSAVQEIAFTLADGIAYVEAALNAGLKVDDFTKRISFFFNVHNNFLEEIAKFRAARRLWAKIMKERFAAQNPSSCMLRFHTQTAGCTLTAQQPDTNIVRVTLQALAAVLGGTQSLHTNSRDEALALPSEESVRIALRTQQIIAYESGVTNTADPLGGSYAIENLTSEIERKAQEYIDRIDSIGGMLKAIESGFVQREIQESSYLYQKKIETREQIIVGLNQFQRKEEPPQNLLRVNPETEKKQMEKLHRLKSTRDSSNVKSRLKRIEDAARKSENLVPVIFDAVKDYATLGEISNVLRAVFGEYKEHIVF
ncbi:MAG: methylmalonyl-CoA mutase [Candidatus Schekmanbacteria bacterium RIFCSPHIGHO2_02_FULL_38_11]|uniref:Methylmalonyl-CoA mutase n=1 Tax=Candidatus Schekmanbacteria bacterium RIFCSPLOWO2_12_FULL_38_15 TaxID=1817883 RepID=A0A1F7SHS3_9BACT|nr:MAG: methylmalonyl-CoA mutase [Candidatus Schekmanbacteria bacterium GWA2_38_9]OGL50887.1 MAG: methylmalonyl-CoA mutase [Candidatus Schekmanbacteria bacterium RIFCSPLOWO2_02_FULL_38_14]OGL53353.1 MAG: methylmalonyl-CoA mutase [Candidatus Schekmanbacteria bacterium RIFCSPLOWO2_12_FULL_38_15]OGL54762.1 MAG: methylmalonyl-CoA mutase [Candidatus Schekmanbacteria bacterium RIFCSPHIGHO2_02_FULL_38_11]